MNSKCRHDIFFNERQRIIPLSGLRITVVWHEVQRFQRCGVSSHGEGLQINWQVRWWVCHLLHWRHTGMAGYKARVCIWHVVSVFPGVMDEVGIRSSWRWCYDVVVSAEDDDVWRFCHKGDRTVCALSEENASTQHKVLLTPPTLPTHSAPKCQRNAGMGCQLINLNSASESMGYT